MLTIRLATEHDIDKLLPLAHYIFDVSFSAQNNPDDFQVYTSKAFTSEQFLKEFQQPNSSFFCAYLNHRMIGYLKLNVGSAQTELQDEKALEIERIYIHPEQQGKGIGKKLLQTATKVAQQHHLKYIWLGVWEENSRAIRFYERNGFVAFDTHSFWLGSDEQTDILMKKIL
jgi:ribosomal protein S18 acetylase RimI-like enzyme